MKSFYYYLIGLSLLLSSCTDDKVVIEISLNKTELTLAEGANERLVASFNPAGTNLEAHSWKSANPQIASIDEAGMVTAIKEGNTKITATALNGGNTASCNVKVVIMVSKISLNVTDTTLLVGDNLQLEAIVHPENATDKAVNWETSDERIASISSDGLVTTYETGEVTITATTSDGSHTATATITITDSPINASTVVFEKITSNSVIIKGELALIWRDYEEIGVCYSTEHTPTIDDRRMWLYSPSVNREIMSLDYSTTYYLRFYIKKDGTTYYSQEYSVTTKPLAGFSAPEISYLSVSSAIVSGFIEVYDASAEKGICISTSSNVTIENGEIIKLEENDFLHKIDNLQAGTTYYLKMYAVVNGTTYYGDEFSFTTKSGVVVMPTCIQLTAIFIRVEGDEEALNNISGVCYSKSPNPTINDMKMGGVLGGTNYEYWTNSSTLSSGTDYYIRAYSTINGVTTYYDECKVQTVGETMGKDFGIAHTFYTFMSIGGDSYAVYLIDYDIEEKGYYDVKSYIWGIGDDCGDYIMGGDSDGQTISSGRGVFYLYLKRDSKATTRRSRKIDFINTNTGVKYVYYDGEIIEEYL